MHQDCKIVPLGRRDETIAIGLCDCIAIGGQPLHVVELCGSLDLHGLADRLCRSPSGSAAILIQSERNLSKLCQDCIKSKICLNCNRMANIRNCDAVGWIAKDEIINCTRRACFGDRGAPRGLQRTPRHLSGPALESGLRPDGQPLG